MTSLGLTLLPVGLSLALVAISSALGQAFATGKAMEGMSRQPEVAGEIRTTLLLALAFMEALTLFTFVMAILMWTKIS
ncbi:MAG TPA: ATP synthase F0 subunit C [Firmicutes bacterium]|nr:ATP synthase F0 subunit C [Bacillota bacterium]